MITSRPKIKRPTIIKSNNEVPRFKEYFNLELWALQNNYFVHPAFLKAEKTKTKILIVISATAILSILVISIIGGK